MSQGSRAMSQGSRATPRPGEARGETIVTDHGDHSLGTARAGGSA